MTIKDEHAPDDDVDEIAADDDDQVDRRHLPRLPDRRRVFNRRRGRPAFGRWRDTRVAPFHVRLWCLILGHAIDDRDSGTQVCSRCRGFRQRTLA
jgi:hypothetical protein